MSRLYTDKDGESTNNTRKSTVVNAAVNKMMERQKAARENSQRILDYYTNRQQGLDGRQ